MNFGYPISETSRLTFGLTVQQDEIKTGTYTVDEIFKFIDDEGDSFLNFKASAGWSSSTLNKGTLPTRGASQSLTAEVTVPGSDLSFYKLDYRGQLFTPLTDNLTMRFHGELGYGDGYGSTSGLPFYENYYAGGFNSVRGFKDSTLGPRSTPSSGKYAGTAADPDQDPLAFGGNVQITGGAEILFPLPFVKDQRSIRTSLFMDVGNVFDTNCPSTGSGNTVATVTTDVKCSDIDFSNVAVSAGLGVTWVTALGPLSFSLAMPVKKPDNAETQLFQFSLGQTF
jgi:outer membrane protein insertion porin family